MTNCPEKDFILPDWDVDYGDYKKVTETMLRDYHKSLCYLKDELELVDTKTGPQVRKIIAPPDIDEKYSYGHAFDEGQQAYKFSDETSKVISVDFSDLDSIKAFMNERRSTAQYDVDTGKLQLPTYSTTEIIQEWEQVVCTETIYVEMPKTIYTETGTEEELIPVECEVPIFEDIDHCAPDEIVDVEGILAKYKIDESPNIWWMPGYKKPCGNLVMISQSFTTTKDTNVKAIRLQVKKGASKIPLHVGLVKADANGVPQIELKDRKIPNIRLGGLLGVTSSETMKNAYGDTYIFQFDNPVPVKKSQGKYAIVIWTETSQGSDYWTLGGRMNERPQTKIDGQTITEKAYVHWNQSAGWQELYRTTSSGSIIKGCLCFEVDYIEKNTKKGVCDQVREIVGYEKQTKYVTVTQPVYGEEVVWEKIAVQVPRDYWMAIDRPVQVTKYHTTAEFYSRVIRANPITRVVLEASDTTPENTSITYEVSPDGQSWYELNPSNNFTKTFSTSTKVLIFRATLETDDDDVTPSVSSLTLNLTTKPATEAYIVTQPYTPVTGVILGANVWNGVDVDYDPGFTVKVGVDIIGDDVVTAQIPVSSEELIENEGVVDLPLRSVLEGSVSVTYRPAESEDDAVVVHINPWHTVSVTYRPAESEDHIIQLHQWKDYVVDYENAKMRLCPAFYTMNLDGLLFVTYTVTAQIPVSSEELIENEGVVDLPLRSVLEGSVSVTYRPAESEDDAVELYEFEDYVVDYENAKMTFYTTNLDGLLFVTYTVTAQIPVSSEELIENEGVVDLPLRSVLEGSVSVTYRPAESEDDAVELYEFEDYVVDYENAKMTFYTTNLDGLLFVTYTPTLKMDLNHEDGTLPPRLDSHREYFEGDGETEDFTLAFVPIDPIARVQIDEEDLVENIDFDVDYEMGIVHFRTPPGQDSIIEIHYTPDINDPSLRLGIRMTRETTTEQCYVYSTTFIYRV